MACSTISKMCSALLLILITSNPAQAESDYIETRSSYISTGDNQWDVHYLPMDSKATINAAFDVLAKDFGVKTIWWRGAQDQIRRDHCIFRKQNRFYYQLHEWFWHLLDNEGTNRAAIEAAHKNNMKIWAVYGMLEFATQADAGACIVYPYQSEDNLRLKHPEWIPVNKYGTRRQPGPIEYAYPQARKAMIDRLTKFVVDEGYDGISFYTYVENFGLRYADEFGYNQPIVDEFKKRYSVNIRTEDFDKEAWAKLRGEYITQFLRELRAAFSKHGKKICMQIEPGDTKTTHSAMTWRPSGHPRISTAGNIYMDWETWAREGIVDELSVVWLPSTEPRRQAVDEIRKAVKGTNCKVSVFMTHGDIPKGVTRMLFNGLEVESGFGHKNKIGWPDAITPPQPLEALTSDDVYAKRRVLYMISKGKQTAPLKDILAALKDPDVYVRRAALRALAKLKNPKAVPAIEEMLFDPENSVRCQAALVLAELNGPKTIDKIYEAVKKKGTFQFTRVAVVRTLSEIGPANINALVRRLSDPHVEIRFVTLRSLQFISGGFSQAKNVLLNILNTDPNPYMRELAAGSLSKYYMDSDVIAALLKRLKEDDDEVVQVRSATRLTSLIPASKNISTNPPVKPTATDKIRCKVIDELLALFKQYGDGRTRGDADWGWRAVGNTILNFGDEGEKKLKELIGRKDNRRLAELAWRVVYIRQKAMAYCTVTEIQDAQAHAKHPFLIFK